VLDRSDTRGRFTRSTGDASISPTSTTAYSYSPGQARQPAGHRGRRHRPARARLRPFHLLGDPPVHVMPPGLQRRQTDAGAPAVPGADVAEVGPAGVPAVAEQERRRQPPGRIRVQFRHPEGR